MTALFTREEIEQCIVSDEELHELMYNATKIGGIIIGNEVLEWYLSADGKVVVINRPVGRP